MVGKQMPSLCLTAQLRFETNLSCSVVTVQLAPLLCVQSDLESYSVFFSETTGECEMFYIFG
jgi:hypothetical protein